MLNISLKRLVKSLFLVLAIPVFLFFLFFAKLGDENGVFYNFSQFLSIVPGKAGTYLRAAFYRLACPDTSDDISIGFMTILSHRNTTINSGVYIGPQSNIGSCTIGAKTLLGSGVHVLSGAKQHHFSDPGKPIQDQDGEYEKITIGSDCWIGNSSIVMRGISDQSIVAAGSVVTKPIEENGAIYAGNPARRIGNRLE